MKNKIFTTTCLFIFFITNSIAQDNQSDSLNIESEIRVDTLKQDNAYQVSLDTAIAPAAPVKKKTKWYKTRVVKASIAPVILFGLGLYTMQDHGIYSSYDAYHDIQKLNFKGTSIDDYLIYAPYVELVALNLLKIKCKNDFLNTAILIVKTELIMTALTFPIKNLTHITRPDSVDPAKNKSFPSGHTSQAFAAASIIHKEYQDKSVWYGVGAYTIAAGVGAFRMLNNRHWLSDVFGGAAVGIASAHIAYLTHRHRWGRKEMCVMPIYRNGGLGVSYSCIF